MQITLDKNGIFGKFSVSPIGRNRFYANTNSDRIHYNGRAYTLSVLGTFKGSLNVDEIEIRRESATFRSEQTPPTIHQKIGAAVIEALSFYLTDEMIQAANEEYRQRAIESAECERQAALEKYRATLEKIEKRLAEELAPLE